MHKDGIFEIVREDDTTGYKRKKGIEEDGKREVKGRLRRAQNDM